MKIDLHMHSCYSADGEFSVAQLAEKAKEAQLDVIALSDHDTTAGVEEMIQKAAAYHIEVIPAIECSTVFEGMDVHLLGYGIDIHDPYFHGLGAHIKKMMDDALHERVVKLEKKYGVKIDEKRCIEEANGGNAYFNIITSMLNDPANAHIEDFRPYQANGSRSDSPVVNFFWDKAHAGTDLFVAVNYPSFKESVEKIHQAGGIAVLAHPWIQFYEKEDLLEKAIACGIDGIEAFSNYHNAEQNAYFASYAKKKGLLITCGSDFHGKNKPKIMMGEYGYHGDEIDEWLLRLKNTLNQ